MRQYLRPWHAIGVGGLKVRVAALQQHEAALRRHGAEVEEAFVAVGAALQEQTRLAAELVEQGRRFNSFTAAATEDNPVRAAVALIDAALTVLESFRQEIGALTDELRRQHEEIGQVRHNGAQLERAIAPLRIVDTLFRIEAAGLPPDMQTAFSALTQEIAGLDLRVRETFQRHFEALGTTRQALASAVEHLSAQRSDHDRLAAEQHAAMRRSLASLEEEIAWLRRRDERSAGLVEQVDRDTNAIVVGLQYQDITRQKLEHVIAAIGAMAARTDGKIDRTTVAFIEHATRLEASQLNAIEDELRLATETIDDGARKVVAQLERLEGDGFGVADCRATASRVEATVATLLAMLEQLRAPMQRAAANAASAARAVESFGGITADLGDTIRDLTWGIRLIALNAQVQAAQVERCDGLEVLARHTYLVSEETSRYGETLGRDLAALAERLGGVVRRAETFTLQTAATRERLDADATRVVAALTAQRDVAVTALERFSPLFGQIRDYARRLVKGAALAAVDREPLRRAEADLRAVATWCAERSANRNGDAGVRAEFERLQRQYTMASERQIHEAVLNGARADGQNGGPEGTEKPMPAAPAAAAAGGALGDNVELF